MKSYKLLCAVLLLILTLTACGEKKAHDVPPVNTTVPVTTRPKESSKVLDCVGFGREQMFRYTDKNKNEVSVVYRIPKLRFDTPDAQAINEEITQRYTPLYNKAGQTAAEKRMPEPISIDYSAFVNDDIVTLLIKSEEQGHNMDYDVYNYNKKTGKRLDNAGLLRYLQRDYEDTFASLKTALEADYLSKFKEENFPDDYYVRLENTTGDEAIKKSSLFLNGQAELYAACTEYAGVGDGEFQVLISLASK